MTCLFASVVLNYFAGMMVVSNLPITKLALTCVPAQHCIEAMVTTCVGLLITDLVSSGFRVNNISA